MRLKLQLVGFLTIREVQMQSCGKTKSMSTSQAREINNIKKLTIRRLRNVSRKDCGIIVSDLGIGVLISILYS